MAGLAVGRQFTQLLYKAARLPSSSLGAERIFQDSLESLDTLFTTHGESWVAAACLSPIPPNS